MPKQPEVEAKEETSRTVKSSGRVRALSRDRLYYAGLICFFASVVYFLCIWLAFREAVGTLGVWAGGAGLFSGGLALFAHGRRIPRRLLAPIGSAFILFLAAALLHSFVVTRSPGFTMLLATVVLGAGAMQSSTRWLIVILVASVGSWLVAGFVMFGAEFTLFATGLIFASFIAIFGHLFVMRYLRHIDQQRRSDVVHGEELAAALAATQRELTERRRAEAERERLREQLIHSQKLEAVGTLAGGVAHDVNNVLAAILGLAELTLEDPSTAREGSQQIIAAALRGTELVRNLLGFSRRGKYRKERLQLGAVVSNLVGLLSRTLPKSIDLTTSGSATHAVEGDSSQLGQVLLNLCLNASEAMAGHGPLRIDLDEVELAGDRARSLAVPEGPYVRLVVSDAGCGMTPATRSRIFEPFFTTKEPGRGIGLGLSMVYGTIANHGGAISVDSEPGRGTSIALHLPAVEPAPAAARRSPATAVTRAAPPVPTADPASAPHPHAAAPVGASTPAGATATAATPTATAATAPPIGAERPAARIATTATPPGPSPHSRGLVLVVDDEPLVRAVTKRTIERAGYAVITACDGAEGVARFQERAAEICIVLLDMAMPVMGGAECFRRVRAIDPDARVLLASGYALEEEARTCLTAGALGFLEKPFTSARLLAAITLVHSNHHLDETLTLPAL